MSSARSFMTSAVSLVCLEAFLSSPVISVPAPEQDNQPGKYRAKAVSSRVYQAARWGLIYANQTDQNPR